MDYKKLYEQQYGKKITEKKYSGLKKFRKRHDQNRYIIAEKLINQGDKFLDLGCGDGDMIHLLENKFNKLYGVDVSPSRIKRAKIETKKIFPNKINKFKFSESNLDKSLPFQDNFFDVITCLAVIEHVYDIFSLVEEMHRVLKPSGYIIAEVPNIAYLKRRIQLLFGKLPVTASSLNWKEVGWERGHIHYFTMKKFCWLFEQQGFQIKQKTGGGILASYRNWWPTLLTGDLCIKAQKK
jgi:methionine biosynthesis protein MetW